MIILQGSVACTVLILLTQKHFKHMYIVLCKGQFSDQELACRGKRFLKLIGKKRKSLFQLLHDIKFGILFLWK